MNGPFQVAQASTTGTTNNTSTTRIFNLTKPVGDQAVTINLGYDQKVKVDFSAIANEKITLVHLGDKLIILFDNKSTLTLEPFFDSRHDGLNNLSVEVAPGRDVSVSEFASLFPITTDQSVLPAAGDGNGNAQASGANFSPSVVDPLGIRDPLALLGQEELGNFRTGQDQFDGTPTVARPTIVVGAGLALTVDESFIPVVGSLQLPAGSTVAVADYSTIFTVTAPGGVFSQTYALTANGTASNLIDSGTGQTVVLVQKGPGEVDGIVTIEGVAVTVFTLTVDAAGHVTMTDLRAVHEANPADSNDGISLAAGLVSLTVTVTDLNGNDGIGTIDLGPHVTILDDGPSITAREGELPSLTSDESFLTDVTNAGVNGTHTGFIGHTTDHHSFAGAFTSVAGADGATIAYTLGIGKPAGEGGLIDSGLIDSATGAHVVLVLTPAGVIEGHVGTAAGATVFTISVDAATAEVTLTQLRSVHESDTTNNHESTSLNSVANLVTLTATITDGDGDHAKASIDLGAHVTFYDDGPSIKAVSSEGEGEGSSFLHVDESYLTAATNGVDGTTPGLAGTADHASFAGMFIPVQGADHATVVYTLGIAAPSPSGESQSSLVDSGLVDSATGQEVVLVLTAGGVVEGHVGTTGGALVFTLAVDAATAEVTLTQLRSVHEGNPNSNNEGISLDLVSNLVTLTATITDNDGDHAAASIDLGARVTFYDDGPTLSVTAGEGAAVVDETPGLQTASGATDVAFSTLSGAAQALFTAVLNKGSDPDVSHDHGAIGYAVGSGLVTATVNYGADHGQSEVFALTLGNDGMDSGLKTTEGREIFLFLENGVIVGRYDSPNDGNTTVNHSDPAAFAIAIDPATGDISIAQYVSLNHPAQATATDGFNSYNEAISLATGTVSIAVTVTDKDNDSVTKSADVSGEIRFLDDGPKVTVVVDRCFSVVLDETPGVQSQDDDTTSSSVRHLFDLVANTGNDPDLSSGQKDHGAIGFAIGNNAALDVIAVFGADGPTGECTNVFSLTLNGISGSVDSGLQTTDGKEIYLTLEHGMIVGRVDTDGDQHVTTSDPAAFAIAIDGNGHVATAEYLSLHHGDPHADDESVQLASGTVSATVTITDGDGDTASASADISGKIQFEDDVPVAHDVTAGTILDDEAQSLFPANFGGSGDVSPSVNTTSGGAGTLFDSGADGTKTVSFAQPSGLQAIYKLPSGFAGQETVHYTTTVSGDHTILTAIGDVSGNTVFTLNVGADGSYVFKVSEPLVDPVHSTTEENLSIKIGFTVTDGDGDHDTGSLTVKVNDDTPTVEVDQAQHDRHDVTLSTLTLDESIGAMVGDSNAATDDVPGVTAPSLLTSIDASKAIGIISTPTSALGTSVAELFDTHVSFGADGPKAAAVSTYSFTLKDDHGNTVSNSHTGVETNLVVTELAGTALQGTTDAQRTVYLFQAADGSIVGRIGNNPNGDIALHIVITGSASDPQITVEQYLPVEHSNHGSADESTSLTFEDRDAGLGITLTVTATDGDGDVATDSKTVSLADCNTSLIKIEDDGPTVTLSATSATVVHDETSGLQTAADPNAANDVHFIALLGTVQTAFTNVSNPGSDPDLTLGQMDHGAIGYAKSAAPLVTVATDFGTDGHAINNAQILALAIAGGNGVNSGLKTTDGHEIDLFLENGLIVGRYDGSDADTTITNSPGHVDPAAFAIAISQDGTISLAQYVSLFNPTPGASYDEAAVGLKSILATVTVTDGDGDTATKSVDISGQIQFQDDGPTLTVTAPAAINGLDFGNFVLNNNAWGNGSGVATGTNGGWTIANSDDGQGGSGAVQLERVGDGYQGMHSSTGGYMVDLDASPHDVKISQTITGLTAGQTYDLRFEAGAPFPNQAHLEVWFGGVKIAPDVTLTGQMQEYKITLTGGSGDGSNLLEFRETGAPDNQGTYLANVSVGEIVIDETAGIQSDSNEVAANSLFNAVAHQGTDPDMAPQFAQGTSAAVSVTASFGADGPAASGATVYSLLTTNNVDSGLTTTAGQSIHLFNETYSGVTFVVGRYDSNNSGTIDSADDAAFAFRIDPGTGKLSLVQYVSLHQPNTASNDEGVFLNTGSLSVNVTITDGDGDTIAKSADISANIRFDDDGPVATSATVSAGEVYEDGLLTGNPEGAPGSQPTSITITQANLGALVHFGADGPGGFGFNSAADGTSSGLSSDGSAISYHIAGDTLSGVTVDGRTIFTLVDTHDGNFKFTLLGNVDHGPLNSGLGDSETLTLNLASLFTATDGDGDTVVLSGGLNVTIENDIPVVTTNTNLIVNGSFEDGHPDLGNGQWSIYHTLPGWTSADIGATGPHGDVPFEVQTGAVGGVPAEDGNALIELDSDLSSGNLSGGDHFNDSGHTNATIQQVVHATESGQTYELTFWYAPRPSEGDDHSGSMEVLWNGNVVKTIDSMGMTPGVWQQITVFVEGTGPDNVLGFHGTGQENSLGAFIDNVSLVAAAIVDEDGLPSGNHDSQPGDIVVPNGDGDSNEATATGLLNIKWGADDFNGGADTHGGGNPANGFVQDTSGRKVTFTDDTVGITGGALTSHGDTVVLSVSSDGTVLTGTATHGTDAPRTVFEVSLSDDGSGAFRFILKDALDHTTGQNENNIVLSFNYTATDSDGDKAPGSFQVLVNDDVPVAAAEPLQSLVEGTTLSGHFDFAPGADGATVTHVNGVALVFGVDGYSQPIATDHGTLAVKADGSYLFTAQADDFYLTGGQVTGTFTVTDHDGDPSTAGFSFAVTDDADVTTVTLSDVTVFEGAGTATILASVDHAPQGSDLVLSLSNGSTVTILAGHTTGTSTPFAVQGDDPYVDHESYVVSVSGATGGNYEALNTTDTSTVTVNDTITPNHITLDDVTVLENQTIVYTAHMDYASSTPFSITLSNNVVLTFAPGSFVATSAPQPAQGDDVYLDGEVKTVSISSTSGGNFEAVNITDTATVTITDTIDPVTATLTTTTSTVSDTGGSITYVVTLSSGLAPFTPKSDLVFTLTNGETVTIPAGQTSGSTTHVYSDADITNQVSITDAIASVTGGTAYESLLTTGTTNVPVFHLLTETGSASLTVSEAALDTTATGNDILPGLVTGSNPSSPTETAQSTALTFTAGSDNISGIVFGATAGISVAGATGTFAWVVNGSGQLEGHLVDANGPIGIILSISGPTTAASGGTATPTITATLTDNFPHAAGNGDVTVTGITLVASDTSGHTASGAVSVTITDDVPAAHADSGNVTEGALLTVAATGVLANDTAGADGVSIAGVRAAGVDLTTAVATGIGTNITGLHGTLNLHADGSYTYQSTANNITSNTTDTFVYTIKDGDGDLSTTTLTINLSDVTLVANNQTKTVNEAALDTTTTGSDLGHGTVTGSLGTTDAGETVTGTLAVAGATGYTAQSVTGTHGLFQLNANGTYTYTLTTPVTESPAANNGTDTVNGVESFSYTAHDANNNIVTGTITINVTDDVPTAVADSGNVTEGALLTVAATGVLANDTAGADGASIAGVRAAGADLTTAVATGVGTDITGLHGTLHLNTDGSYTYQSTANNITANTTDKFVYTIKDGDGDLSTTTLTINLSDVTLVANNQTKTVNEAALDTTTTGSDLDHGTVTGSLGTTSPAETVTGTLAVTGATGYTAQSVTGTHGLFQLNANGTYTYTLTTPVTESPAANNGTDTVNGVESFSYTAHDANNNTVTGTVTINVTDDVPTANADAALTVLETAAATSGVNLLANDVQGADGAKVTGVDFGDGGGLHAIAASGTTTLTTSNGIYTFQANGTWTFDPSVNPSNSNTTGNFTYTITDGDGDTSAALQTVNITNANSIPVAGTDSFTVNEDGLTGGIVGGPGDVGGTTISHGGTLPANFGADGAASSGAYNFTQLSGAVLDSAGHAVTSGGAALSYFWDNTGHVLYASTNVSSLANAQATDAFTVSLNTTNGAYTFTEIKPIDHPGHDADGANNGPETAYEDNLTVNIGYQVTDSNGDHSAAAGTLAVTINDDTPSAVGDTATVSEGQVGKTDILVMLDVSQSMDSTVPGVASNFGFGNTRLDLARYALLQLVQNSSVDEVKIVLFRGSDRATVWLDKASAITFINNEANFDNSALGSGTNYDAALFDNGAGTDKGGTHAFDTNPTTPGDARIAYFLSDGEPTEPNGSIGISTSEETTWINYLNAHSVTNAYAIGFGDLTTANANALEPVAVSPGEVQSTFTTAAADDNVFVIVDSDFSSLGATLSATVPSSVNGNVSAGTVSAGTGGTDHFGADGGRILSITVNGTTYTWDGSNTITETGAITGTLSGNSISANTSLGGHLNFFFSTVSGHVAGDWNYTAPNDVPADSQEVFHYVIKDNDGDTAAADLTVNITAVDDAPLNTVPAAQTVNEDTALVFNAAHSNLIQVSDVDANGGLEQVTLTVSHGTLSLFTVSGLNFTAGDGTADATMTFKGTIAAINAALNGLTYQGVQDHNGADTLTITTNDLGNTGTGGPLSDTDNLAITVTAVNDAPTITSTGLTLVSNSGSGAVAFAEAALSAYGADVDNTILGVGAVTAVTGLQTVSGTNLGNANVGTVGTITVDDDNTLGGTFTFTISDGTSSSSPATTVTFTNSATSNATLTAAGSGDSIIVNSQSGVAATLTGGSGRDYIIGNSASDIIVGAANDIVLDGGGGTDTLKIGASFTSTSDAQIVNIENVLLTVATSIDFTNQTEDFTVTGSAGVDSIKAGSGADIIVGAQNDALLDGGGGTDTLQVGANFTSTSDAQIANIENVTLTAAVTLDLSNQTEAFNITGSSGADVIKGGSGADTITGGLGADTMTGNGGSDTFVIATGDSTVAVGGTGNTGTITGYDIITDFDVTADKLNLPGTVVLATTGNVNGGGDSTLTIGGDTVESHSVNANGIATFFGTDTFTAPLAITSLSGVAAVVQYLSGSDIGAAGATLAFTATISGVNHTYIYEQAGSSAGLGAFVDLQNVTITNLTALVGNHVDPIILDLDNNGFAFTSSADGVAFDLNGDGVKDQVAWTTNGQDGILALDVNGSGKIESGNELFTPTFAGGHFANGIAALASLDTNHDGVIDSHDPAFSQLVVWQDANHNGVSDSGELAKLSDLGIKSIDLATMAGTGPIDGQNIAAIGSFTYVNGTKGSFVEADLDTSLVTPSSTPASDAAGTHHDLPKGGMEHVVDFTPTGHGELNFAAINPGVPAGGEQSHFTFVDAPLMHDTYGDNSAAAAKMALAILQAGGTVDTAHLPVAH